MELSWPTVVWAVSALAYFGWAWRVERNRQNRERNQELGDALANKFSASHLEWRKHL